MGTAQRLLALQGNENDSPKFFMAFRPNVIDILVIYVFLDSRWKH